MKKIVSLFAAIILALTVIPVSAVPDTVVPERSAVTFTVDTVTAKADQDVEVSLTLEGEYEANALTVFIEFDNTRLSVKSIALGEVANKYKENDGILIHNVSEAEGSNDLAANIDGRVGITGILPEGSVTETGTVFTVVFHTAEGLENDAEIPLTLDVQVFTNLDLNSVSHPVEHETTDGKITIDNREMFTITWKNWNGDVLKTEEVEKGLLPEYTGETPTKPQDDQYSYEFDGWDPEIVPVSADAVYTAKFKQTVRSYFVTWKNWDGSILKTDTVEYGTVPEYTGETPTKPQDDQYSYEFDGWDPEIVAVSGDAVYTAKFKAVTITTPTFIVTFVDGLTNEVIKTVTVEYGGSAEPPEVPVHDGYIFLGWEGSFINVTSNVAVTARYGVLGDADGNGEVEASDALLVLRMAMDIIETPANIILIDADGDGEVTAGDALLILRYAMGIIAHL